METFSLFSPGLMTKPARLDWDRESLVRVRRMCRIADGGRIPTIRANSNDGFYHTVWRYRRFQIMGIFAFFPPHTHTHIKSPNT